MVHTRSHYQSTVFRRIRGPADQPACFRIFHQIAVVKQGGLFQDGICPVLQESFVLCEQVMLPKMMTKPPASAYPDAVVGSINWCRSPPQISIVVKHPTGCIIIFPGSFL